MQEIDYGDDMFNEKNIPRLIILTPILTIIVLVILILYSFIKTQQDYFLQESTQLEKNYLAQQKNLLQKEVDDVFSYIKYHKNLMLENEKKDIEIQMKAFMNVILSQNATPDKYLTYIKQNSNDDTDFIIYDVRHDRLIQDENVFFDKSQLPLHRKMDGTFMLKDTIDLFFFRYIPSREILIILEKDIYYKLADLKISIARWIENIRFGNNNYLWVYSNTNKLIANPYRKEDIGKDDTFTKDANNTFFVQKLVNLAIKNPKGSFFEFYPIESNKKHQNEQLGFAKYYSEWNWIVGCGVNTDQMQKNIKDNKLLLEQRINKYIQSTVFIALLLIFLISVLSILTSYKINKTFKAYQDKVNKKEMDLQGKIEKALLEAKEKDKAMLHQSRLARMGNIINMISHQWRQPLSQLSGIMMELETTVKFKKADDKFLFACANDASKIIQFMSLTIEDFRNFFKPDRDKQDFSIADACDGAIGLIKASLNNQHITLNYEVQNDKMVTGYKREYSQVILNLLLNAKDAIIMNNIKNGTINLSVRTEENRSIVTVQDNAGGVDEENINSIFEPYFSTKKSQGTGLGLYMSKMIIEKNMQGQLSVKNDEFGAIFTILL
ncbi:sensor histidine kinase [Sulfurospirillum sp. 1612]|uniref:sensor histidine kinase n=1 Tax=Sulfurospirillum sp. 1612 TaxID=3094835 RepID=UPI002F92E643